MVAFLLSTIRLHEEYWLGSQLRALPQAICEVSCGTERCYAYAAKVAQGKFHGTIEEQNGKLAFKGDVATEADKNEIWDAIKTIPTWQNDIVADIARKVDRAHRPSPHKPRRLPRRRLTPSGPETRSAPSPKSTWGTRPPI